MYKPKFNKVLVEVNDEDAKWGKGSEDNLGGEVYREGKLVEIGLLHTTADYPLEASDLQIIHNDIDGMVGKQVMWNEGHEAGTVFEHPSTEIVDGEKVTTAKKYALIYWWDIIGVKE